MCRRRRIINFDSNNNFIIGYKTFSGQDYANTNIGGDEINIFTDDHFRHLHPQPRPSKIPTPTPTPTAPAATPNVLLLLLQQLALLSLPQPQVLLLLPQKQP